MDMDVSKISEGLESAIRKAKLRPLIWDLTPHIFRLKHRIKWDNAIPEPDDIIWIDPEKIKCFIAPNFRTRTFHFTSPLVVGGDWDQEYISKSGVIYNTKGLCGIGNFDQHFLYVGAKEHYKEGVSWEDTVIFNLGDDKVSEYHRDRLEFVRDRIIEDGYKTQIELQREGDNKQFERSDHSNPTLDEVNVNIGRNGEYIFDDGKHRLTIAKLLSVNEIPVRIFVRHRKWQILREKILDNRPLEKGNDVVTDHPDIQNII